MRVLEGLKNQYGGKKILVVGLGLQGGGVGLVNFFSSLGAWVTATDLKTQNQLQESLLKIPHNVQLVLGKHDINDFLSADIIFKGPSVPWSLPELVAAQRKGIPIEMESSLFASVCPVPIIGITGTRGKTTVSTMIYDLMRMNGKHAHLGGNISGSSTIQMLDKVSKDDIVVLELSSWQLAGFTKKKFSPHIAVFTNVYPDHLNLYNSMNEYVEDKKAIYIYQGENDYLVAHTSLQSLILADNPKSRISFFQLKDFPSSLHYLRGEHNKENAAAVLAVSSIVGLDREKSIEFLTEYKPLPFRLETVGTVRNMIFINDTTSTTPIATIKAIQSCTDTSIILLLGGNSKRLPYEELTKELDKAEYIVLLKGTFTDEILPILKKKYSYKLSRVYDSLQEAVGEAIRMAYDPAKQYSILFSPGATSFSLFKNEFDRGEQFNEIVKRTIKHS